MPVRRRWNVTFLVGVMQGQGNSGREAEVLELGIDLGFASLAHEERLAYIRGAEGEAEAAIRLLTQVVETSPNPPAQARLTLFLLMVENGQAAAAVDVAVQSGLNRTISPAAAPISLLCEKDSGTQRVK